MKLTQCKKCSTPISAKAEYCTKHRRYRSTTKSAPKLEKKCLECGSVFMTSRPAAKVCSVLCRNKLNGSKNSNLNRNYGEAKCEVCQKVITLHAGHQKYCSSTCSKKANYLRNIETYKKRDKIKITRQRIGLDIRDVHLGTPSKDAKWLWDGLGKWSVKYWPDIQECLECNTSVYQHNANGICERCYDKLRPRDPEEMKKWQKKSYERAKARGHKFSGKQAREWIDKAKKQEIPITPTIENLLDNLERL